MELNNAFDKIQEKISQSRALDVAELPDAQQLIGNQVNSELKGLNDGLSARLREEFFHDGPLVHLIANSDITEIIITRYDEVWYEAKGQLYRHSDSFLSQITYQNFVDRVCQQASMQINWETPFADGYLHPFRIHIAGYPVAGEEPVICFRRHPESSWTLESLFQTQWCDSTHLQLLKQLIFDRENILVIGITGSGKTSVLNALMAEVSSQQRMLIIEESKELRLSNRVSTRLLTRKDAQKRLPDICQKTLLKQSLRMRPDRLIMGEIRGEEAKDLLMALSTGHPGSMGTLHADNAHQALLRLEMLIQMGAPQWQLQSIRNLIYLSLKYIVHVKKESDGRKLGGIYKISGVEPFGLLIDPCV